ncbi:MAG: AMP-binding protein [Jatrophihabitans sp.]|uniref:AMP-binding protein n=1 Tax=Jatrophihabitans sp. TaxID=1932789 RepID=UPI003F81EBF5
MRVARTVTGGARGVVGRALHEADNLRILARAGLIRPLRPDKPARMGLAALRWGGSIAALVSTGAIRHPDRTFVIDDLGEISYAELDAQSNAVANALREAGVRPGARIGLMCRDHRGFVLGAVAAGKLGADVLLLNTSFSGKQLSEVCDREDAAALIHDEEFTDLVADAARGRIRMVGWHEHDIDGLTIGHAIRHGDRSTPRRPGRTGRVTILTSGTTGTPKGASREKTPLTLDPPAALLERIPFHEGQVVRIGAPLFHAWGLANFALGLSLGSTFVLRRRFDPEQALADVAEHHCDALVVVPVMLQRILALPDDVRAKYDTSSLVAVAASGSALPGELATRWMDAFGDNLYNMYGSTEVATGTLATPTDLRAAPGTAGKAARGVVLKLYDAEGEPVPQGETGRIFVGNSMLFEGYTGGGSKDVIDGLMATGDVGYLDDQDRLFVQGRDDEMIVSGGENVFPKEVEDVLADHPAVAEAACVGVDDDDFGQRLKAFVVLADGQSATEDELKAHVRDNLARYKVPREVVLLDELPRNPTGKVLKRELLEHGRD